MQLKKQLRRPGTDWRALLRACRAGAPDTNVRHPHDCFTEQAMWQLMLRATSLNHVRAAFWPVTSAGSGLLKPPLRFMYCRACLVVFVFTAPRLAPVSSTCCPCGSQRCRTLHM